MRFKSVLCQTLHVCALVASFSAAFPLCALAQQASPGAMAWPHTVLITNDDGVDDPGLLALARAFAVIAETYVVAPLQDQSGTTHMVSAGAKQALQVQERDLGEGIRAYGVDGYPADCVLLALQGIMVDHRPDLVVSGINGGPNLGFNWLASGTIGAARLATVWGVPAIAVSGLDASVPEAAAGVAEWVTRLAQSELGRSLKPGQYLTVSFPLTSPSEFKGIRVAERAGILLDFRFARAAAGDAAGNAGGSGAGNAAGSAAGNAAGSGAGNVAGDVAGNVAGDVAGNAAGGAETWVLRPLLSLPPASAESDAALHAQGYVVVVPMQADEHDRELLTRLLEMPELLPR